MSDRATEVAQEFVPENATRIMVDTRGGDRRGYSADEWREQIGAALRAYAEEARREEREACAKLASLWPKDCNCAAVDIGVGVMHEPACGFPNTDEIADEIAAAIRAREEGKG